MRELVGAVGRDARGVLYEEAVPGLAVFLVWPDLTGLEAGFGEHERSRKVVPQCVAHEVEFVQFIPGCGQDVPGERSPWGDTDRKSTRLNSSHANISYAVFCLKKKKQKRECATIQSISIWLDCLWCEMMSNG